MDHVLDSIYEEALMSRVDKHVNDLFRYKPGRPQLQFHSQFRRLNDGGSLRITKNEDIYSIRDFEILELSQRPLLNDSCKATDTVLQIFVIQQPRTWAPLNISYEVFEKFMTTYTVLNSFWDCVFTFRRKDEENELEFPRLITSGTHGSGPAELAYVLRRVELHGRKLLEGQSPWSIRQTAVYHKYNQGDKENRKHMGETMSTFMLIAPSPTVESKLSQLLDLSIVENKSIPPIYVHALLLADSLKGWKDYLTWLGAQVKELSDRIAFAAVDGEESESGIPDIHVSIEDRQTLKLLEDSILDLKLIFPKLWNVVEGLKTEFHKWHMLQRLPPDLVLKYQRIINQLDNYGEDLKLHIHSAEVLRERAQDTAKLLSDLLNYENAIALKNVATESHEENKLMVKLTESGSRDAFAMKVLTIISLVYLPTTMVANFFSTQLVQTGENGYLHLSPSSWLLAALAIPLTLLTIVLWWLVAYGRYSWFLNLAKASYRVTVSPLTSLRARRRMGDLEAGTFQNPRPSSPFDRSPTLLDSRASTNVTTIVDKKSEKE